MPTVRIVAFLGTRGNGAIYQLDWPPLSAGGAALHHKSAEAPLPADAWLQLAQHLSPGARVEVLVVGTKQAQEYWLDGRSPPLREALKTAAGAQQAIPILAPVDYDADAIRKDPSKLSEFLQALEKAFNPEATDEEDHHVLIDVTRGYRSTPLLALNALDRVLAENRRRAYADQKPRRLRHHILYAAIDAVDEKEPAPIWDLTAIAAAQRLNAAVEAFLRHGQGVPLTEVLAEETFPGAQELRAAFAAVAGDLALLNVPNLLTASAPAFLREWEKNRSALGQSQPMLQKPLAEIAMKVGELLGDADAPISLRGLASCQRIFAWLLETDQYLAAAGLLNESLISAYTIALGEPTAYLKKDKDFTQRRLDLADRIGARGNELRTSKREPEPVADRIALAYFKLARLRNDLLHFGFKHDPEERVQVRQRLTKHGKRFQEMCVQLGRTAP